MPDRYFWQPGWLENVAEVSRTCEVDGTIEKYVQFWGRGNPLACCETKQPGMRLEDIGETTKIKKSAINREFAEPIMFMISGEISFRLADHCSLPDLVEFRQILPSFLDPFLNLAMKDGKFA